MESRQLDFHDERKDIEAHRQFIKNNRHPIALFLDQVSDIRNIGSILRLADAARVEKVFAYQMEEKGNEKKLRRVARMASDFVPLIYLHTKEDVNALKEKYQFVALEITNSSIPYTEFTPSKPCLLIVGNEQKGVSPNMLKRAEYSIHIPMFGINTSMNVAMSVGIAVYGLLRNIGEMGA